MLLYLLFYLLLLSGIAIDAIGYKKSGKEMENKKETVTMWILLVAVFTVIFVLLRMSGEKLV